MPWKKTVQHCLASLLSLHRVLWRDREEGMMRDKERAFIHLNQDNVNNLFISPAHGHAAAVPCLRTHLHTVCTVTPTTLVQLQLIHSNIHWNKQTTSTVLLARGRGTDVYHVATRNAVHYSLIQKPCVEQQLLKRIVYKEQYVHIVLLQGFTLIQNRLTTRVGAQSWRRQTNHLKITNLMCSYDLQTDTISHTVLNTHCCSCQLPSRMKMSKCFSKIFLPFSIIWMVSNVRDPWKKNRCCLKI